MQAIHAIEMGRNRLQYLRESAPGAGDGLLPAGMCMFSVIVIGVAIAVALYAAWAKTDHSADRQTPTNHAPPTAGRSGAETPSLITAADADAAVHTSAAEPARQDAGTAANAR
jgi:hypothetical protein